MRTMFDACNPAHIPADAQLVAGYIEGPCAWPAAAWARFPHAVKVRICTVAATNDGQVIDVEAGDSSIEQAVGWAVRARMRGQIPTVYCSASNVVAVIDAFAWHQVARPLLWIAHYGVPPVLPAGAIALQYANEQPPGCDSSVVADYWPGVDPAPQPIIKGDDMLYQFIVGAPINAVYALYAGRYFHVTDPADEPAFAAIAAHPPVNITAAQHAVLLATYGPSSDSDAPAVAAAPVVP